MGLVTENSIHDFAFQDRVLAHAQATEHRHLPGERLNQT